MQEVNTSDDIVEIDLQEIFGLLLHWLWLIILCGIVTGAIGFSVSNFLITPLYQSSTTIYILNKQSDNALTYSDVQLNSQLTRDYAQLIKSRTVLEKVIAAYVPEETYGRMEERVDVEMISDTRIISITVFDEDPLMAQFLANEIRKEASLRITEVMDIEAVNVVDEANLPQLPYTPSIPKWTLIGMALGMFLSAAFLIIRYLMDDTIKTSDDVEQYLGLSTLAMIPVIEEAGKTKHGRKHGHKEEKKHSSGHEMQSLQQDNEELVVEELEAPDMVAVKEVK